VSQPDGDMSLAVQLPPDLGREGPAAAGPKLHTGSHGEPQPPLEHPACSGGLWPARAGLHCTLHTHSACVVFLLSVMADHARLARRRHCWGAGSSQTAAAQVRQCCLHGPCRRERVRQHETVRSEAPVANFGCSSVIFLD